jgi:RNA polymerase sigma-70 factor (sigma-E family)
MGWQSDYAEYFAVRALPLRQLAYAICGDWHLADDLVQHTFLQLYHHWRRLEPATLDAYSRKVLVNAHLSHRRRHWREHIMADPPDRVTHGPGEGVEADVGAALATLPPRQRVLVVLRYLEGMSISESAELLGIAEGTVKSQTARGLEKLRVALQQPAWG